MAKEAYRWIGDALEALRIDYEGDKLTMFEVSDKHGTSNGNITRLAVLHGWRRRRPVSVKGQREQELLRRAEARKAFVADILGRYQDELDKLMAESVALKGSV